jgi:hypothetical protein
MSHWSDSGNSTVAVPLKARMAIGPFGNLSDATTTSSYQREFARREPWLVSNCGGFHGHGAESSLLSGIRRPALLTSADSADLWPSGHGWPTGGLKNFS